MKLGLGIGVGSPFFSAIRKASVDLDLDFITGTYIVNSAAYATVPSIPGYTFTRTGEQGALKLDGTVQWFNSNVPAITNLGYFSYPSAPNITFYSQDFTQWIGTNTVTPDAITAPDGTLTADMLTETGSADHYSSIVSGNTLGFPYTWTCFVKAGTARYVQAAHSSAVNSTAYANFDLQTGTVTATGGGGEGYIINLGTGWYRLIFIATTASVTGATILSPIIIDSPTAGRLATSVSTGKTLYAWNCQMTPEQYIDGGPIVRTTSGAIGTLTASKLTITNTTSVPAGSDYIWYGIGTVPKSRASSQTFSQFNGGGDYYIGRDSNGSLVATVNGAQVLSSSTSTVGGRYVVLARVVNNNLTLHYKLPNGTIVKAPSSATVTGAILPTSLKIGNYGSGTDQSGSIELINIAKGTFTDQQVSDLLTAA